MIFTKVLFLGTEDVLGVNYAIMNTEGSGVQLTEQLSWKIIVVGVNLI
jgi:hypothetical protein